MKLSNFDWTDKTSVRWFLIGPEGHEGPYDFFSLQEKCLDKNRSDTLVWAEGLLHRYEFSIVEKQFLLIENLDQLEKIKLSKIDIDIPLNPDERKEALVASDELPPEIPIIQDEVREYIKKPQKSGVLTKFLIIILSLLSLTIFSYTREKDFKFDRPQKMSLGQYQEVQKYFTFEGWSKDLAFKEFVSPDLSEIWLVTSSFQACQVNASFTSLEEKQLSLKPEAIHFNSSNRMTPHTLSLSEFQFTKGNKIVPGMYEVNLQLSDCEWSNFWANAFNFFKKPIFERNLKINVVLHGAGLMAYHSSLSKITQKRAEIEVKKKDKMKLFYQDLILKYQTLDAITQQIEESFGNVLKQNKRLDKTIISQLSRDYSRNQAHFLTKFVKENELYFQKLKVLSSLELKAIKEEIEHISKSIGGESMLIIESLIDLSQNKNLPLAQSKLNNRFSPIKKVIETKISLLKEKMSFLENRVP